MEYLTFSDRLVPYDTFLNDIASRVAHMLKCEHDDPEFVNQSTAFSMFGRRNVERWRKMGKITAYKRPGKVEYRTADLRLLQRTVQDYFQPGDNE